MIAYTHLAHQERYQIYVLKEADIQQSEIARLLGRFFGIFLPLFWSRT